MTSIPRTGQPVTAVDLRPAMIQSLKNDNACQGSHYSDSECNFGGGSTTFYLDIPSYAMQTRLVTSDWASAQSVSGVVLVGNYVYLMLLQWATAVRIYRYDKTNLAAGGTLMTFSGQALTYQSDSQTFTSDGTNFFFSYKSGGSANDFVISKFTVSGTAFTYVSDTSLGAAGGVARTIAVDDSGNYYGIDTSLVMRKYNSSGTLQLTSGTISAASPYIWNKQQCLYLPKNSSPVWWTKYNILV